jgi:GMP synthase-like glutamine amidotransferase
LGSAAQYLTEAGVEFRQIDLYSQTPAQLPLEQSAGLLILGGAMSANDSDQYPFLAVELDWIRQAIDIELPTLGICLGAQLMAKALGAKVFRNPVKEIGWYQIEMLGPWQSDPLFCDCQPRETVFQWHGDTFDLPQGSVHLSQTTQCCNQVFRMGPSAYAVQFHVEMTPSLMAKWLSEPGFAAELRALPHIDPEAIRRLAPARFPAMNSLSRRVLGRFAAMCRNAEGRMRKAEGDARGDSPR